MQEQFVVEIVGEVYKEGSSDPWRGGKYTAVVVADSRYEAVIEVLEGLGNHGSIKSEGGDYDWAAFDSEREVEIRVKSALEAAE